MKVKELIKRLNELDQDLEVWIDHENECPEKGIYRVQVDLTTVGLNKRAVVLRAEDNGKTRCFFRL